MIVAGVETITMTSDYSKTPDHTKSRGFEGTLSFYRMIQYFLLDKISGYTMALFWVWHGVYSPLSRFYQIDA